MRVLSFGICGAMIGVFIVWYVGAVTALDLWWYEDSSPIVEVSRFAAALSSVVGFILGAVIGSET